MKRTIVFMLLITCFIMGASPWIKMVWSTADAADIHRTPLSRPTVNTDNIDSDNLVPINIVNRIALQKAQELWGQVTPGEPIACSDQDGNISTYMCPFRIGGGPFPSYEQIMQGVEEGRSLVKEVEEDFFNQPSQAVEVSDNQTGSERESYQRDAENDAPNDYAGNSELGGGNTTEQPIESAGQSYQEALKEAKEIELGIGEYGTIYVSARYDLFPIPLCSHYLSPYYLSGDLAQEKARNLLGEDSTLTRYYFLGRFGQYFTFSSENDEVSIHAYSLEIEPVKRIPMILQTREQIEEIRQEWDKMIGTTSTQEGGEGS
jgi:hypothetical protein